MPRANRYYQKHFVYHITHRCNRKNFYLRFNKEKQRYRYWLYQAVKKYKLSVLDYVITNNHIHLLVHDTGNNVISNSMQLISSRVAIEFNKRKSECGGAFWQGKYFATAVQEEAYLINCMVYIALNMVRCGVVQHPMEWRYGGYVELINPRKRYKVIDEKILLDLCGITNRDQFIDNYNHLIEEKIKTKRIYRESIWTSSSAVGDDNFISCFKRSRS